jgi:hypothetical protein
MLNTFSGRPPGQDEGELRSLIALMQERGVRRYLEVGSRYGDTFWEVMTSLPKGSVGVAVDMPGGPWGTDKSRKHLERAVADLKRRGYKVSTIFGNSQTDATRKLIVGRGPYDAALLDGDHTLAGVTRDWELYGKIAPLVAFHDIVGTGMQDKVTGSPVEVPILWERIKASHQTVEFVTPGSLMGIGVVCNSI